MFFMHKNFCILIEISHKIVPKCPIDSKLVPVLVKTRRQTSVKQLPESMLMVIYDAIWCH